MSAECNKIARVDQHAKLRSSLFIPLLDEELPVSYLRHQESEDHCVGQRHIGGISFLVNGGYLDEWVAQRKVMKAR